MPAVTAVPALAEANDSNLSDFSRTFALRQLDAGTENTLEQIAILKYSDYLAPLQPRTDTFVVRITRALR